MPIEPNHRAHELLTGYAQQRREQAGPPVALDPGVRARLQAEVARHSRPGAGADRGRPYAVGVSNLWLRLILGGACAALVIAAATVLLRVDRDREMRLAQSDQENLRFFAVEPEGAQGAAREPNRFAERVRRFELGTPPAATAASATGAAATLQESDAELRASSPVEPAEESRNLAFAVPSPQGDVAGFASNSPLYPSGVTPPSQPTTSAPATSLQSKPAPDGDLRLSQAPAAPLPRDYRMTPAAGAESMADSAGPNAAVVSEPLARRLAAKGPQAPASQGATTQQALYFQQDRRNYRQDVNASPAAPQVLTEFEVQRSGPTVRIVDADGSVYTGTTAPESAAQEPFSFEAVGTNRTLKQLVVFTGEFEPPAPAALATQDARTKVEAQRSRALSEEKPALAPAQTSEAESRTSEMQRAQLRGVSNPLSQGRIQGNASVGGKSQIKIEAQQVVR